METLGAILILIVATWVFVAAPRYATLLRWTLGIALVVFAGSVYVLFWAPRDLLSRVPPFAATALQTPAVGLYLGASFVLVAGIALGFLARYTVAQVQSGRNPDDSDPPGAG